MSSKSEKLKAMQTLFLAAKHNPKFKKEWADYIEITVTEALEEVGINDLKRVEKVRKYVAEHVINLFDPDWAGFSFEH